MKNSSFKQLIACALVVTASFTAVNASAAPVRQAEQKQATAAAIQKIRSLFSTSETYAGVPGFGVFNSMMVMGNEPGRHGTDSIGYVSVGLNAFPVMGSSYNAPKADFHLGEDSLLIEREEKGVYLYYKAASTWEEGKAASLEIAPNIGGYSVTVREYWHDRETRSMTVYNPVPCAPPIGPIPGPVPYGGF